MAGWTAAWPPCYLRLPLGPPVTNAAPPNGTRSPALTSPGARSLRSNIFFAVSGMGVFHAAQFGVIVLLAKYAPSDVLGQVRLSLAIATPIITFFSLELRGALVADAAGEFTFGTYRKLRSFAMLVAGVLLAAVALWQAAVERNLAYTVILAGMCASRVVLSLAEIGWGLFQKRERLDWMATSVTLRGIAMIAAFGLCVPLYAYLSARGLIPPQRIADGAALAIGAYVVASVAVLLLFDHRLIAAGTDLDPTWTWPAVRRLAQQTFPLGIVLLVVHLCNSIPELVVGQQANGKAALGYFGALATLTLVGNLLVLQAATAAANRLAYSYQVDLRAFLLLAAKLLGLAVLVGAATLVVAASYGRWLLELLYRADYARFDREFTLIAMGAALSQVTSIFGVLVTQMRLFWLQVPAQVLVLVFTAAAAFVLIPGAENLVSGGAWTMLVRSVTHLSLYTVCVLIGLVFRQRVLASRVTLAQEPVRRRTTAGGVPQDW